ncbi:MAG TPA: BrnT family toxin [Stellaceae bacterium]|nr:BrnT family toxin [Stellaceae bacterium]
MQVEFDPEKNAANLEKHGVSLDEAAEGLLDPLALVREDGTAEGEVCAGRHVPRWRLLTVCYTLREKRRRSG